MPPSAYIFDFDGVLCHDYFYTTLLPKHQRVYDWIQQNIFGGKELVCKWMRNEISSAGINKMAADNTGIDFENLHNLFLESIRQMRLDKGNMNWVQQLKTEGRKLALVTNNMDVFTQITVENHNNKY